MRTFMFGLKRQTVISRVIEAGPAGVLRDELIAEIKGTRRSLCVMLARARYEGVADIRMVMVGDGWRCYSAEHIPATETSVKPFVMRAMKLMRDRVLTAGVAGVDYKTLREGLGSATADLAARELRKRAELFFRKGNQIRPGRYFAEAIHVAIVERIDPNARVRPIKQKAVKVPKQRLVVLKPGQKPVVKAVPQWVGEPIIPKGLKPIICPPTRCDERYRVEIPPGGGVITRDWRERRPGAMA